MWQWQNDLEKLSTSNPEFQLQYILKLSFTFSCCGTHCNHSRRNFVVAGFPRTLYLLRLRGNRKSTFVHLKNPLTKTLQLPEIVARALIYKRISSVGITNRMNVNWREWKTIIHITTTRMNNRLRNSTVFPTTYPPNWIHIELDCYFLWSLWSVPMF